ncbi:hypothetical protein AN641_08120 [Candidatus Epulonipiscioides gigas]|nr:hypothetical protein AN641_08120 [Epulopiscium sp. SCG-C07WGA-EpuloA2]
MDIITVVNIEKRTLTKGRKRLNKQAAEAGVMSESDWLFLSCSIMTEAMIQRRTMKRKLRRQNKRE